jgi:predicted enzyme related to lactoylglutathione lyase
MLQRDGYPPGVPCFVVTSQPDPVAAARFYDELFGWSSEDRMPPEAPGHYFAARLDGLDVAGISSQSPDEPRDAVWSTYIAVESAADAVDRVRDAGGSVLAEPFDVFDAGRTAVCADPQGARFSLWQAGAHIGAQVVNAPGSWNWSDLNTTDVEAAKEFYGAVFGWETTELDLGVTQATMWRMPGYGDALERSVDPDIRRRQAAAGVPAGFEDAIGWLVSLDGDDAPPSHWAVTFAVDGTDEVADRAARLGGAVVTVPFDAGPARIAGLRDPQGAAFAISTYSPRPVPEP